jgi:hypothetical protein
MIDLERSLTELAERLEIPDSEWLVSDVVRRIGEPASHRSLGRVPRLAGALVAIVIVAAVVAPGPRHAIGRWLGFDSVRIEPEITVPTTTAASAAGSTTASSTTSTVPGPNPALGLGEAVSIDEATSRTGLPDPTPSLLGDPQSVHVVEPPDSGQIVLVYASSDLVPESDVTGVGALVSVLPFEIDQGFFRKTLGATAAVRPVHVDDIDGYWIEGSPHELMFVYGNDVVDDTFRLATNTLLWQRGGNVFRLEADISLATAVRIAKTVS